MYKEIAAYEGQEITEALERILNDKNFCLWLKKTTRRNMSPCLKKLIIGLMRHSKHPQLTFDRMLVFPFLSYIRRKSTTKLKLEGEENALPGAFFITNHRDIVLDAAFLSLLIWRKKSIRPYLGVGNNLFGQSWIQDLMRSAKCFAVIRTGGPKDVLHNAEVLSSYIAEKQKAGGAFWLAQREGRAKDSNDRTQPAVLKMLTLAETGSVIERLKALHITPVSITYEYDPCDWLKAREMQLKRDNPDYKKTAREDMLNMQTGLKGQKGKVVFNVTPCINDELDAITAQTDVRNEQLRLAAEIIDRHIHQGYQLAWTNLAAQEILNGGKNEQMEAYIASRIAKIDIPNRDDQFLRERILEMYANPAINHDAALQA